MVGRYAVLEAVVIGGIVLRMFPAHPNCIDHLVTVASGIRNVMEHAEDAAPFVIECEKANLGRGGVVERAERHLPSVSFLALLAYLVWDVALAVVHPWGRHGIHFAIDSHGIAVLPIGNELHIFAKIGIAKDMNALAHPHFGQFAVFRLDLDYGFYELVRCVTADHYQNGVAAHRLFAGSGGDPFSRTTDGGNSRGEFVEHKRMWLIRAT